MGKHQKGIHHITALSGDAQRNAEFYVKSLAIRSVFVFFTNGCTLQPHTKSAKLDFLF